MAEEAMTDHLFAEKGLAYRTNAWLPERTTLVFVHGLSGSASAWKRYEDFFADHYNLVTFDLRGHGLSRKYRTLDDYAFPCLADDLEALRTHLGVETFVLVSHSFGTLVAAAYLTQHAAHVRHALWLAPAAHLRKTRWFTLVRSLGEFGARLFLLLPFCARTHKRVVYEKLGFTPDWDLRRIRRDVWVTGLRTYLFCLVQAYRFEPHMPWQTLATPSTVLHGTQDSYVPCANGMQLASTLPHARFVKVEGANHILVLNNFSEVQNSLSAILAT